MLKRLTSIFLIYLVISFDSSLSIWDTITWELVHTQEDHTAPITAGSLTQDGKYVISASKDGTLKV